MDMDLYNILAGGGLSARMPEGGSALGAAIDQAAARDYALRLKREEEHKAALDDLANQAMFEQYLTQGTAFQGSPRELGTGALRDRNTLAGSPPRSQWVPAGDIRGRDSVPGPQVVAEGDAANEPLLQGVFAKLEREGKIGRPLGQATDKNGVPLEPLEITDPNIVDDKPREPVRLDRSRLGERLSPQAQRYGAAGKPGYAPRRTEEGRKNAQAFREKVYGAATSEERLRVGKEYGAREAELRAATAITVQGMRDAAALARQRAKGPGKTDDPIKWVEKGLGRSQQNLAAAQKHYDGLAAAGFRNTQEAEQARAALEIAQDEADAWQEQYKTAMSSSKGSPERGAPPSGRGSRPTPTGNVKTDENGTVWEEMSDGSARKRGA